MHTDKKKFHMVISIAHWYIFHRTNVIQTIVCQILNSCKIAVQLCHVIRVAGMTSVDPIIHRGVWCMTSVDPIIHRGVWCIMSVDPIIYRGVWFNSKLMVSMV